MSGLGDGALANTRAAGTPAYRAAPTSAVTANAVPAPSSTDRAIRETPAAAIRSRTTPAKISRNGAAAAIRYAETSHSPLPCVAYQEVIRASDQLEVGALSVARPATRQAMPATPDSGA